jgi:putative membrane protein
MPYGSWYSGPGAAGWLIMLAFMVFFWGAIIWIVLTLVHQRHGHGHSHAPAERGSDALQILDQRFARGEIDEEEYRRRRDLLRPGD